MPKSERNPKTETRCFQRRDAKDAEERRGGKPQPKSFGLRREAQRHAALAALSAIGKRCRRFALPPQSKMVAARGDLDGWRCSDLPSQRTLCVLRVSALNSASAHPAQLWDLRPPATGTSFRLRPSGFGLLSDFGFRISEFISVFRLFIRARWALSRPRRR